MAAPEPADNSPSSVQPPPSSFRSSSRGPIGRTLSRLGSKIANTLGSGPEHGQGGPELASSAATGYHRAGLGHEQGRIFADDESTLSGEKERSVSRGRDVITSTGRGGAGNIRSVSRDYRPDSGPDNFSDSRGREPRQEQTHTFATGRGGAGNIRSPSRDVPVVRSGADDKDQGIIKDHLAVDNETGVHSTGRGGVGNIRGGSGSRSRSGARDSLSHSTHSTHSTHTHPTHSTGRGGVGNIFPGAAPHEHDEERESLAAKSHHDDTHSTGRGGSANVSHIHPPPVEHSHHEHHPGDYESTGRGGVGNIIRE